MFVTVLGEYGPYPAAGGACSGYLVSDDARQVNIAVDMGTGTLARLLGVVPIDKLTALVLTHLHYDHMSDALPLQYAMQFAGREPLPVYAQSAPEGAAALLQCPWFDLRPHEDAEIGGFAVRFLPAAHPVPGSSVSFSRDGKRVVMTGDTNMYDALTPFCEGADLLVADAGLTESAWTPRAPHLSATLCGRIARDARAGGLLCTHLSPRFAREDVLREAREAYPGAILARAGDAYHV